MQREKRYLNIFLIFRNKFEENILQTIDETCKKLTRFIQEDIYVDED